jgi:ApbE superfamily uncharacterized protein (UPF0280 family)
MDRAKQGFEERTYRDLMRPHDLVSFRVTVQETDLFLAATKDLAAKTRDSVYRHRYAIETYIASHPVFLDSLVPLEDDPLAPGIVREMLRSAQKAGVGPMAGIAGAIAHFVGDDLLAHSEEVIVENGGDIYIKSARKRRVAVYAGSSPLSMKIGIVVPPEKTPIGVCTSSGTVGPSLSFGRADAACILSSSPTLADAAATAVGNRVKSKKDIDIGLGRAKEIDGVLGALVIIGDAMGVWGDIELVRI